MKFTRQRDCIIAAVRALTADDFRSFSPEQLLVACWQLNPKSFGLRGYEHQHPDSAKLRNALYGAKGLIARRVLVHADLGRLRPGPEMPIPTDTAPAATVEVPPVTPAQQDEIGRMLLSDAYLKFASARKEEITFSDFVAFTGARKSADGAELSRFMAGVDQLTAAKETAQQRLVAAAYEWMVAKFERHTIERHTKLLTNRKAAAKGGAA